MIRLNLEHLVLLGLLSASTHWLIARSLIFKWLWSRAPGPLDKVLTCAACSGFWLGLGLGALGVRPLTAAPAWIEIVAAGALGIYLTPIVEGAMMWGLRESQPDEDGV